ncbi:MAG: D-arabinono-1,4-lactone oxidase [Acidimicrobiales bacterium]|nr:D-arabinono-1,4-lactone oxidase [Acidimicrobiales bacterium]
MSASYRNWAGNQVCLPTEMLTPGSADELAAIVARAAENGQRVKAVGAGHSFTAAAMTDGVLLSLDKLNEVESIDTETGRVTVGAGMRLHELNEVLDGAGLAMPNLGDIAYQSIAGATATATHGTGAELGNLATTIVGMEIVDGQGQRIWCDENERPDLLRVARVGVGALGIVTRVTLQCVPAFDLRAEETIESLDDLLGTFADDATANDHFEFFWMPGARRCQVKRNNRTEEPRQPESRSTYFRNKILAENIAFGLVCKVGARFPSAAPRIGKLVGGGVQARDLVDKSYKIFASPRWVRFYEMEYGIPREALPEALGRLREFVLGLAEPIFFPVEVRVSAGDDIPLSTASGRDSAWIAVHVHKGGSYETYFQGVEQIMNDYDGRPHWGKLHFQDHTTLAPRYPEWDLFQAVRAELDPEGRFANAYTDRVLGPIGG